MNTLTFHNRSTHPFWSPKSWNNKYTQPIEYWPERSRNWYQRFFGLEYTERFPGSATIFVFLTDGYHLTQFFFLWCITLSLAFAGSHIVGGSFKDILISAVMYRVVWWTCFNVVFTLVKKLL